MDDDLRFLPRAAVAPLNASAFALGRLRVLSFGLGWLGRLGLSKFVKGIEIVGRENLKGGPHLILMNHSNPLDPLLMMFYGRLPVQFLVTEPYMAERLASRVTAWLGQIPKRKLDNDTRAIRTMKEWAKVGASIGMFPEGQFSWDGDPLPFLPGLNQLVNYLDIPVVTARLFNGDRLWPAWATHPRQTSLRLEIDPPVRYSPGTDSEAEIKKRLYVNPETSVRFAAKGNNLAGGLSKFLRWCFHCHAEASLKDQGDELYCEACRTAWQVTAENRLQLKNGASSAISIKEVWAEIRAYLEVMWKESLLCESLSEVVLYDATRPNWKIITHGKLILENNRLNLKDWSLDLGEVLTHTMDWGDLILIRTARQRLALKMPKDSRAVWTFAFNFALQKREKPENAL